MTESLWASSTELRAFRMVLNGDASASEKLAAQELQAYWKAVFGVEPATDSEPMGGPAAWIGFAGAPEEALEGIEPAVFEPQELVVRTFKKDGHPHLLLAGGPEDGTLYAVYQFIEDYLGVRWLTAWDTHIPAAPAAVPAIDYRYAPPFQYRYTHYFHAARAYKDSQPEALERVEEFTRHMRGRHGPRGSHTFYRYVPPSKYAAEHPEYYSLVKGRRIAPRHDRYNAGAWEPSTNMHTEFGQLCMTNPEVIEIIKGQIEADIAEDPGKRVHHISPMDWHNWCECDNCAAIDEQEGAHMGSVLWALNQIADWLADKHPGHKIETLAYQYTRRPPKHMKPRPNIMVRLCSIECDWSQPLFHERNQDYVADLETWCAMAAEVTTWDYYSNYCNFAIPAPNFHVIAPNMRFLAKHAVKGLYEHGSYDEAAEFAALRGYMLGKLMWNPDLDAGAVMDDFLVLYYGESGQHVRRYIELLSEAQQASGRGMGCFDKGAWYTADTVMRARQIMSEAYAAAQNDEVRFRLDRVNATVEYNALKCAPTVEVANAKLTLTRPDSLTLDEYVALLERIGMKFVTDYFGKLDYVRLQIGGATPPRRQESPLLCIENERYRVAVAPEIEGTILRFYDKELQGELLADPKVYGTRGGFWQDWTDTPGKHEHVIARTYEVIEKEEQRLVIEAKLSSGLRVRRTMTLEPGQDAFRVELTITNESGTPQPPLAKIHPEFYLAAGHSAAIHGFQDGAWQPLNKGSETCSKTLFFEPVYEKLAYYVLEEDRSVFVEVHGPVGGLLCYYTNRTDGQHMNLDLRPPQRNLAPGESIAFGGTFGAMKGTPFRQ